MLSNSFKWKHFVGEIILLNVRWGSVAKNPKIEAKF
jgi:hypothetical protein